MRGSKVCVFVIAALLTSCGGAGALSGTGSVAGGVSGGLSADAAFGASCLEDFGDSPSAQKLEAFMAATGSFRTAANETLETLLDTCRTMGQELGMSSGELAGSGTDGTRSVCNAVSERLRSELSEFRSTAGVTIEIRTRPPQCSVSVDAYAECSAECDVEVEPGSVDIQCEGGEIRGGCSAECTGNCAVDVSASCEGTCEGMCDGTCSATAEDGSCTGSCDGNCQGQCVAEASGSCSGQCRGGCSVDFEEPSCTGEMTPPNVSADCRAACDARLDAEATCEPGEVQVTIQGELGTDMMARFERVQAALQAGLGTILTVSDRVERLQRSGQAVVQLAVELPGAVAGVGLEAANCARGAITELQSSVASVSVSVEVSVSVSGSVAG